MPVSSLPSPYGIGTLGKAAYRFVDFLHGAGIGLWQVLPLLPTSYGDSPYQSCAANALNPYLIDLDLLAEEGLLKAEEYISLDWGTNPRRVDYSKLYALRTKVLRSAFSRFDRNGGAWREFLAEGKYRGFALFMALKEKFGGAPYTEWGEYAEYDEAVASAFEAAHRDDAEFWQFTQFLFLRQWKALKEYANGRGVEIMGDMPIYLSRDSVEMWQDRRSLFLIDGEGNPAVQAGVPPDAFSDTGQLWGNPVYDWAKMKRNGYAWWKNRIRESLELYDWVRIDHFIGFVRYYCIPEGMRDARCGEWRTGPGAELFRGLEHAKIVAEDLGLVTDEVRAAIAQTGYPGMKILQHAFGGDADCEHKPSNYGENLVVYTGTHDNETLYQRVSATKGDAKKIMKADLKRECALAGVRAKTRTDGQICDSILRLLYASRAKIVVLPLQDALHTGKEGRINLPATVSAENWSYRFTESDFSKKLQRKLLGLAVKSGRI